MKKLLLASVALAALNVSASAADLARKAPPPAPVAVAPVYNWNGFYIGVMGGYGWSGESTVTVAGVAFTGLDFDLKGGFVGGTMGYNFAPMGSSWLLGIEVDGAWADIENSATGATAFGALTLTDRINAIGSVTGRLGWTFGPGLIYAKGGWAWANQELSATLVGPLATVTASQDEFHSGWTIGGGFEYKFAPNWSGKIEYMYADFDSSTFGSGTLFPGGVGVGHELHTIKGGINYHFNWGGGPVVARY
jgi:outer membrane immunogenic protein